jgi:hypothetical protein
MTFARVVAALLIVGALRLGVAQGASPPPRQTAVPATPKAVEGILAAQRFTLRTPYVNTWSHGREKVFSGTLVVLEVERAYVVPRNELEPVLYAGDVAVQRLNQGDESGRVIAIVPGDVDVATVPIWFGTPALPERVTAASARAERALAEKAGVGALPSARGVQRPAVDAPDMAALLRDVAAPLVEEFSPQEKHVAASWRVPEAKAPPKKHD